MPGHAQLILLVLYVSWLRADSGLRGRGAESPLHIDHFFSPSGPLLYHMYLRTLEDLSDAEPEEGEAFADLLRRLFDAGWVIASLRGFLEDGTIGEDEYSMFWLTEARRYDLEELVVSGRGECGLLVKSIFAAERAQLDQDLNHM